MIEALTYEEILTKMKNEFKSKSGYEADDATDIGIRLKLLAGQLFSLSQNTEFVAKQLFLQTATGDYLDKHAEMRGLSRKSATKAHGTVRFFTAQPATADIIIPAGTLCATAGENAPTYETTQTVTLLQGQTQADVSVVAVNSGTQSNGAVGCVCVLINPPQEITSVSNTSELTGGGEKENDEWLRERILKSFREVSNGANLQFYEEIAMENAKVISAKAISAARGAGTVDVVFDTAETEQTQIDAIKTALDTELASKREIGTDAKAFNCTAQSVDIVVYVKVKSGYTSSTVVNLCKQKVNEYMSSLKVGENFACSKLGNYLYAIDGIENYKIISPAEDTAISSRSKLKTGTLTVSDVL